MTYIELLKRIDSLAPLPKTLMDIEEFKRTDNYDTNDLAKIIEQDPLMISTILKNANSAMFGFSGKIDSLNRAVSLIGINFTISIALGSGIKRALNSDLDAYNANSDEFLRIANMQSNLVNLWLSKVDSDLKQELILPAFLQESGKFLINEAIVDENKKDEFLVDINETINDITSIEKKYIGIGTAEVTSAIFKHWNLTPNIINYIKYSDNTTKAPAKFVKQAQILNIVKNVCNILKPFDDSAVEHARKQVEAFGFELKPFDDAIAKMIERLSEE